MSRQNPAETAHTDPEDPRHTPRADPDARPGAQHADGGPGAVPLVAQPEHGTRSAANRGPGGTRPRPTPAEHDTHLPAVPANGGPATRADHHTRPPGHAALPGRPVAHTEHHRAVHHPEDQLERFSTAGLPWYGLDAGWQGPRALGLISTGPDGLVEFGTLRHGDPAAGRPDSDAQRRAVTALTMARLGRRPLTKPDGSPAGLVEAMSVGTAAALAGVGLVEDNWPWELDPSVRQHWLEQQREIAYTLSETLGAEAWQTLTLPVGDQQQVFHYRESTYGWVMAGARPDCFLAAYGRGVSAYSLAFVRVDPAFYV